MWDFFETVRHRHSIRKYRPEMPVEQEKLHAILEMACAAPSAGDLQSYHIIVITDAQMRKQLSELAHGQAFIAEAPVSLLFCSEPKRAAKKYGERGEQLYALQDATIAAAYAQLAAFPSQAPGQVMPPLLPPMPGWPWWRRDSPRPGWAPLTMSGSNKPSLWRPVLNRWQC